MLVLHECASYMSIYTILFLVLSHIKLLRICLSEPVALVSISFTKQFVFCFVNKTNLSPNRQNFNQWQKYKISQAWRHLYGFTWNLDSLFFFHDKRSSLVSRNESQRNLENEVWKLGFFFSLNFNFLNYMVAFISKTNAFFIINLLHSLVEYYSKSVDPY